MACAASMCFSAVRRPVPIGGIEDASQEIDVGKGTRAENPWRAEGEVYAASNVFMGRHRLVMGCRPTSGGVARYALSRPSHGMPVTLGTHPIQMLNLTRMVKEVAQSVEVHCWATRQTDRLLHPRDDPADKSPVGWMRGASRGGRALRDGRYTLASPHKRRMRWTARASLVLHPRAGVSCPESRFSSR